MAETLTQFSNDLAQLVEASGPFIVRVEARRRLPASGVVWSSDGLIVTSHHAVERDDNIRVGLPNGDTASAALVGRDPTIDVAVLRADASDLQTAAHVGPDALRVGHLALALGRPGSSVLATLGIVSALGEGWRTPAGGRIDRYFQTDVVMYPGFSGGPLVDSSGGVAGINTSAILRGVSLVIPVQTLNGVVDTLVAHGRVRRGYLGVSSQPVRLPKDIEGQVGQETALLLASVEPEGPAADGGLMLGDTIITLNGQPTRHLDDLQGLLGADAIGASVPLRILRGGQLRELTVTIGERQ